MIHKPGFYGVYQIHFMFSVNFFVAAVPVFGGVYLLYTFFTAKSREKAFHPGIYPFSASQRYSVESLPQEKTQPSSV